MVNVFPYSNSNKRYHTFDHYLKRTYGTKVSKVTVNGMFNCPNRDGTVATGSCYFCSDRGSGDFAGDAWKALMVQYQEQKQKIMKKWPEASKFIVYFQANTNTHDTVSGLKRRFEQFTSLPEVVAISIGTRPDCLPDDVLDYLADLNQRKPVWIEIGLQTIHDQTATMFNRAYPTELCFTKVKELRKRNISVAIHLINSLPKETPAMMIESVKRVSQLDVQSVKIHMLHIVKNSPWGLRYAAEKWNSIMTMDQYVDTVIEQLKWIPAHMHLERLTGDPDKKQLLTPAWTLNKTAVLNEIDKRMAAQNVWQGMLVDPAVPADLKAREIISAYIKPTAKTLYLGKDGEPVAQMLASRTTHPETKLPPNRTKWADLAYLDLTASAKQDVQQVLSHVKKRGKVLVCALKDSLEEKQSELQMTKNHVFIKQKHFTTDGKVLIEVRA